MRIRTIVTTLVLLALSAPASPARAGGGVVVCDEAHLRAALAGGGAVTFACSGVITLTNTITIDADMTIDGSGQEVTISGNDAVRVFRVNEGATVTLNRLVISHGYSARYGGGISNAGALLVSQSTLSGNNAMFGGGIDNYGTISVIDSAIMNEWQGGKVTLKNTIVTGSRNCYGAITDGGGNLSYPDTSCPGIDADPLLGPLQDNGGPTWTMEPGPGSPAIDAGNAAACAAPPVDNLDQRGVVRPVGPRCDMGAVEVNYLPVRTWLPLLLAQ
jgi:hypothetical protein